MTFNNIDGGILNLLNEYLFVIKFNSDKNLYKFIYLLEMDTNINLISNRYTFINGQIVDEYDHIFKIDNLNESHHDQYKSLLKKLMENINEPSIINIQKNEPIPTTDVILKVNNVDNVNKSNDDEKQLLQKIIDDKNTQVLKRLNELKEKKSQYESKQTKYEADLKAYFSIKKDMNLNKNMKIPELFINKFPVFEKLEKESRLTFEDYLKNEPSELVFNGSIGSMFEKDDVHSEKMKLFHKLNSNLANDNNKNVKVNVESDSDLDSDSESDSESSEDNFMTHKSD